jgi:hypothetical protein
VAVSKVIFEALRAGSAPAGAVVQPPAKVPVRGGSATRETEEQPDDDEEHTNQNCGIAEQVGV